jgi:hypothetical protein
MMGFQLRSSRLQSHQTSPRYHDDGAEEFGWLLDAGLMPARKDRLPPVLKCLEGVT